MSRSISWIVYGDSCRSSDAFAKCKRRRRMMACRDERSVAAASRSCGNTPKLKYLRGKTKTNELDDGRGRTDR